MKKLVKFKDKKIEVEVIYENNVLVYKDYYCKTCNQKIPWNKFHISNGIPETIHGHSFEGKHHTEENKLKQSEILKLQFQDWRTIWNKGKEFPQIKGDKNPAKRPEVKIKLSIIKSGKNNPMFGRVGELSPNFGGKYGFKFGEDNIAKQPDVKKKLSIRQIGELNPNWQGGKSFEPYCIKFNFKFKESIRFRDSYTCQLCGKTQEQEGRRLTVHHIHYDKQNCFPDCVALCNSCNAKVNFNRDHNEELFTFMLWTRNLLYWRNEE